MRTLLVLAFTLVVLGVCAGAGLHVFSKFVHKAGPLPAEKIVFIGLGTGVREMAEQLKQEGVISQPYAFMALVKLQKRLMKAGEYQFAAHISLSEVIDKIGRGDVFARKVTIAEGLTAHEIAAILNAAGSMDGQVDAPPEGSVLPNTYTYNRGDSRAKMLAQMQGAMTKVVDALWEKRAPDLPFITKEQALAFASVVEKETGLASERARIAGVFINRLKIGMRLQSDPTVIYAITKGASKIERVLYAHLETDSPYNTYKYAGVPPGPICSPGEAAIAASLNPEKHDFLYFVADGSGGHVFARTLAEHNANVAKWRAVQKASGG